MHVVNSQVMLLLVAFGLLPASELTQVRVQQDAGPSHVFGAGERSIAVRVHNPSATAVTVEGQVRLFEASSATAAHIKDFPWNRREILAGQTIVDWVTLPFPAVKARTHFVLQWLERTNHVFGTVEVFVYPTNLLKQLNALAEGESLGVFDPANQLKPQLQDQMVEFCDMEEEGLGRYQGKLAFLGPFESRSQVPSGLKEDIQGLAKRGVAVVWLQRPIGNPSLLKPSFYAVREHKGVVVVARHDLVAGLGERPEAQLNLVRLAEEALHPTPLTLPETEISN